MVSKIGKILRSLPGVRGFVQQGEKKKELLTQIRALEQTHADHPYGKFSQPTFPEPFGYSKKTLRQLEARLKMLHKIDGYHALWRRLLDENTSKLSELGIPNQALAESAPNETSHALVIHTIGHSFDPSLKLEGKAKYKWLNSGFAKDFPQHCQIYQNAHGIRVEAIKLLGQKAAKSYQAPVTAHFAERCRQTVKALGKYFELSRQYRKTYGVAQASKK